jgi:hypothetical protein
MIKKIIRGANIYTLSVDIGVHNRRFKEPWVVIRQVSKVIVHESFSINTLNNDIALVKLEVRYICIYFVFIYLLFILFFILVYFKVTDRIR